MTKLLSDIEVEQFINDGYIKIKEAFSKEIATQVVNILWNDIPFNKDNSEMWLEPVVRLGMYTQKPFIDSVNTPRLHAIYNQLVGKGKWLPPMAVGTFPVRFPSDKEPNDTGKHVDTSFPGDDPSDFFKWRANIQSKGRGLLMLVLYSDVEFNDAPTVLYKGSHKGIAKMLGDKKEEGLSFIEIVKQIDSLPLYEKAYATGDAGTIYLCHPFLVHAAQTHTGRNPKFMAQPPLLLKDSLTISGVNDEHAPVEKAIRQALK